MCLAATPPRCFLFSPCFQITKNNCTFYIYLATLLTASSNNLSSGKRGRFSRRSTAFLKIKTAAFLQKSTLPECTFVFWMLQSHLLRQKDFSVFTRLTRITERTIEGLFPKNTSCNDCCLVKDKVYYTYIKLRGMKFSQQNSIKYFFA